MAVSSEADSRFDSTDLLQCYSCYSSKLGVHKSKNSSKFILYIIL